MSKKYVMRLIIVAFIFCFSFNQNNHFFCQNLSVGSFHTQYICKDGRAMSWGFDCGEGRIGRWGSRNYPDYVGLNKTLKKVSAGLYHSLYLDSTGTVWSTGSNEFGQTGTGLSGMYPNKVLSIDSIIDIAAGTHSSLFLRYDGTVYGCGLGFEEYGFDLSNGYCPFPLLIPNLDSIVQISAGNYQWFFVKVNGDVYSKGGMGLGEYFQTQSNLPVKIDSLKNIRYSSAGSVHSLFINFDGETYFCGNNQLGQAGIGSNVQNYYYPIKINTLDSIIQVDAFGDHSLFLKSDGSVWISGRNGNFYVDSSNYSHLRTASKIPNLFGVTEIGLGDFFFIFEVGDSVLYSLGEGSNGSLGIGTTDYNAFSPIKVTNLCGAPLNIYNGITVLDEFYKEDIKISPNPAFDKIELNLTENLAFGKYFIYNTQGQIVSFGKIESNKKIIDVSSLTRGLYYFYLDSDITQVHKIILK